MWLENGKIILELKKRENESQPAREISLSNQDYGVRHTTTLGLKGTRLAKARQSRLEALERLYWSK